MSEKRYSLKKVMLITIMLVVFLPGCVQTATPEPPEGVELKPVVKSNTPPRKKRPKKRVEAAEPGATPISKQASSIPTPSVNPGRYIAIPATE